MCLVLLLQQQRLCLNIHLALRVSLQNDIPLLCVSFPAHWLHGDAIVLQLNRGPAASLLGQRSQVLRPAQLPRWHRPLAGDALLPPVSLSAV